MLPLHSPRFAPRCWFGKCLSAALRSRKTIRCVRRFPLKRTKSVANNRRPFFRAIMKRKRKPHSWNLDAWATLSESLRLEGSNHHRDVNEMLLHWSFKGTLRVFECESSDQVQVLGERLPRCPLPSVLPPPNLPSPVGPQQHWTKPLGTPYGYD